MPKTEKIIKTKMQSLNSYDCPELQVKLKLATYAPKLIDLFGYDVSGTRKKLIKEVVSFFEIASNNDEKIKQYLPSLKKSLGQSRFQQDLELGIFLNFLIDRGYAVNHGIHKSLQKLVDGSTTHYTHKKFLLEAVTQCIQDEETLFNKMLQKLENLEEGNKKITLLLNSWLRNKHKKLETIDNPEQRGIYEHKLCAVLENAHDLLDKTHKHHYSQLPKKFPNTLHLSTLELGELLEDICTRIAQLHSHNNFLSFYEERSKVIEQLSGSLQKLHQNYVHHSTEQINAERILNIIKKYKKRADIENISNSLLQLFEDASLFDVFKEHLTKLVNRKAQILVWKKNFQNILNTKNGWDFFKKVIALSHLKKEQELQYLHILEEMKVSK